MLVAGEELRHAVEEWQMKRGTVGPRLTTGFLDGTNPIVDMYELKVGSLMRLWTDMYLV